MINDQQSHAAGIEAVARHDGIQAKSPPGRPSYGEASDGAAIFQELKSHPYHLTFPKTLLTFIGA